MAISLLKESNTKETSKKLHNIRRELKETAKKKQRKTKNQEKKNATDDMAVQLRTCKQPFEILGTNERSHHQRRNAHKRTNYAMNSESSHCASRTGACAATIETRRKKYKRKGETTTAEPGKAWK